MTTLIDARSDSASDVLRLNLNGDALGLPEWFTHFGSRRFAESALPTIVGALRSADYHHGPISIVGLGACRSLYERTVARSLQKLGWSPSVFVSDLQENALREA